MSNRDDQLTTLEQRRYAEQQAREAAERRVEELEGLLRQSDDFMYIMTGHDSHARLVHQHGREWWKPINELRGKICTALSNQSAPADKGQGEPVDVPFPSEDELIANGLGYPIGKEDAIKLHFAGFRSGVITILEAWDAIGHDIGCNPSKDELLDSLRNMAAICDAHGNDMPAEQPAPIAVAPFKLISLPPSLLDHPAFDTLQDALAKVGVKVAGTKP